MKETFGLENQEQREIDRYEEVEAQLRSLYSLVFVAEVFIDGQPTGVEVVDYLFVKDPNIIFEKIDNVRYFLKHLDWGGRLLKAVDEWLGQQITPFRGSMSKILVLLDRNINPDDVVANINSTDFPYDPNRPKELRELLHVIRSCRESSTDSEGGDLVTKCLTAVMQAGINLHRVDHLSALIEML